MPRISSSLSALRFSGRLRIEVADGAVVFGQDEAHGAHHDCFGLASRPFMLRPLPHRGDVVAAGAVALAALVALLQVRFDDAWGKGIHFVYAAAALAFVGTLALRAPREGDAPRAYQSALLAVTFALAMPTLARLALLLGSDGLDSSGTLAWAGGALAALGFGLGAARDSALCVLLGAVSLVLAVLGFVDLVFSPGGVQTFRWLLLALVAALAAATVASRDHHPARAVAFADAGGLTALALALTFVLDQLFGSVAALRPRRGHRLGALPLRLRLRAVRVLGRRPGAGPGLDRRRGPAGHHGDGRRRQGDADRLAAGAGRRRRRAAGHRPAPEPAAAARAVARRGGPRLRDQERAVSDLKEALDRALGGGPERHHDKAREQGKLPVRERVARLLDDGSFAEEALLANWEGDGLGADGVVTGLGPHRRAARWR